MTITEAQRRVATGHDFLQRALEQVDPQIADAIRMETERQNDTLELIASENHVSRAVLTAMGSVFTNKYAEGDRKSTRLNSSHTVISYAVFCLKKKIQYIE